MLIAAWEQSSSVSMLEGFIPCTAGFREGEQVSPNFL